MLLLDRLLRMLKPAILNVLAILLVAVWAVAVVIDALSTEYNDSGSVSLALGVMLGSLFTFAAAYKGGDKDKGS